MRLEYALTVNDPRSVTTAAIQSASTRSSHMTKADVMTALGICQSRGGVGLSLMYAKYKKDRTEADKAIRAIHGFAVDLWICGDKSRGVSGNGPLKNKAEALAVKAVAVLAIEEFTRTADTPGAKCRCGGRGFVNDASSREFPDEPGIKTCPRCHGTGLTPLPASRVFKVVSKLLPETSNRAFYSKWKLFYELLVERCGIEESIAAMAYGTLTKF